MNVKTVPLFFSTFLVWTLAGCASYQPLEIESVGLIPGAKIEKKLSGSANGKSLSLEGSGTWMYGSDSQELTTQQFYATQARVGATTFTAPQTLDTRFTFSAYDASLRWRHFIAKGPIGYELAGGGGFSRMHVEASGSGMMGEETVYSPELGVRAGVLVRLGSKTRVEASSTFYFTDANQNDSYRNQISLVYMLGQHIAVDGGYARWYAESNSNDRSSFWVQSSGPSIGIRFGF